MSAVEAPGRSDSAGAPSRHSVHAGRSIRLWGIVVGAALIAIIFLKLLLPPAVPVTKLKKLNLRDEASGTGFVRAKVSVSVGAKINGIVLKTHVDQGDVVKKGQVLAELQNRDLQSQVGQAIGQAGAQRAQLNSARANLEASRARLDASASAVGKAQAGARLAEINYKRAGALFESEIWSREAMDSADTLHTQAREDLRNAVSLKNSAQEQVRAAEAEVAAAERNAAVMQAGVRLQRANLDYTIVTSPVDGYVVSRDLEEGGTVVPGLAIFTVAQSNVIWVSVNVDERETGGLKTGQPATITLRSAPGKSFAGKVARVARQADPVTEEVVVDVAFAEQVADLKLNETAEVHILKSEKQGASALRQTAIVERRGQSGVWVVRQGRLQWQPVRLGMRDKEGWSEVLEGLTESDQVLLQSAANRLKAGQRVRTRLVDGAAGE